MAKQVMEDNDFFFPQLPKWIANYGAGLMLMLVIVLLIAASAIGYTDKESIKVIFKKDAQYAEISFEKYRNLTTGQKIYIQGPFASKIDGQVKKEILAIKNNLVRIPVEFSNKNLAAIPIDGQAEFWAEYNASKGSLLNNLFK